jgi:hypothetical protein
MTQHLAAQHCFLLRGCFRSSSNRVINIRSSFGSLLPVVSKRSSIVTAHRHFSPKRPVCSSTRDNFIFTNPSRLRLALSLVASFVVASSTPIVRAFNSYRAMSSSKTLRLGDGTIVVMPKSMPHNSLVIISHGLGDTAEGFVDVAEVCVFQFVILSWFALSPVCTRFSAIPALYSTNANNQVCSADCPYTPRDLEHGNVHARLVRYCRTR